MGFSFRQAQAVRTVKGSPEVWWLETGWRIGRTGLGGGRPKSPARLSFTLIIVQAIFFMALLYRNHITEYVG